MRNPSSATEEPLSPRLSEIIDAVEPRATSRVRRVLVRRRRTNLVSEVHLDDGDVLVIKQGRTDTARHRFETTHAASTLLRGAGIEIPSTRLLFSGDEPVLAYRRIHRPTLHERWTAASAQVRQRLLESWGSLLHRLHSFELRGVGSLADPVSRSTTAAEFLRADIEDRLAQLLRVSLPVAADAADRLHEVAAHLPETRSVVVHNDVFDQNVLCNAEACTGLLDFEDAFAGPPEADFAKLELLHGPLFGQPWTGTWLDRIRHGYAHPQNPHVTAAFRCYALLNMSFHGTTIGLAEHSRMLADVALAEATLIDRGVSHEEAVHAARIS